MTVLKRLPLMTQDRLRYPNLHYNLRHLVVLNIHWLSKQAISQARMQAAGEGTVSTAEAAKIYLEEARNVVRGQTGGGAEGQFDSTEDRSSQQ